MSYKIGDKFIIEIDRIYSSKKHAESRYGIKGFANFVLDKTKLNALLKYGCIEDANEALKTAYFNGVENEKGLWEEDVLPEEYQRGLDDAWEAARKIDSYCGNNEPLNEIFGEHGIADIKKHFSASEAISMLKAYDEKKKASEEINVGDEVRCPNDKSNAETYIVLRKSLNICNREGVTLFRRSDGDIDTYSLYHDGICQFEKTGNHIDGVAELLNAMEAEE